MASVLSEKNIMVPMREGVELACGGQLSGPDRFPP
jgi:hypothetical protein